MRKRKNDFNLLNYENEDGFNKSLKNKKILKLQETRLINGN